MRGKDGKTLEESMMSGFSDVEAILKYTKQNRTDIQKLNKKMEKSYLQLGIVKYDAFNEMGGKLSFALAMLDNNNTGWIINAMHSREGCYTYVKEIVKGESYVELAEEEAEALDKAIFEDGYEEEVDKQLHLQQEVLSLLSLVRQRMEIRKARMREIQNRHLEKQTMVRS